MLNQMTNVVDLHPKVVIWADQLTAKRIDKAGLSFAITKGELVYILGRSGHGKSTVLDILCGNITRTRGSLEIHGYTWKKRKDKKRISKILGYVPQANYLYDSLTPNQMLKKYYNLIPQYDVRTVDEVLSLVHLSDRKKTKIGKLSGGERKRMSIAIELLKRKEILVLDEPDSGLDPYNRQILRELYTKLREQGVTIIVSTHYMESIGSNRAIILDKSEEGIRIAADRAVDRTEYYRQLDRYIGKNTKDVVYGISNEVVKMTENYPEYGTKKDSIVEKIRKGIKRLGGRGEFMR